ncbi:MFS transporter [Nocardioides sp. URHA0032]|uniref:MFS transporter n=1 Tax=Nocardioides sp. URHA0032 TaxID=1380388 RepID=UPI000A773381|nr:MFS transporter [Nocardioides sp. URHA0032]
MFLGAVALAACAAALVAPALRSVGTPPAGEPAPRSRLAWALVGAVAVLTLGVFPPAAVVVLLALRKLLPAGSLLARRGLPSVIGTRGLMSASFFAAEAYIVFVLQEQWGLTPGIAGLALTAVGLTWAAASQVQSRLGSRVSDVAVMRWGCALLLVGTVALALAVRIHVPWALAMAAYVVAGAGMGLGYPRTGVAMLAASSDSDRGFNSSALSIADSLGGALALSVSGVVFATTKAAGIDPFASVYVLAAAVAVLAVVTAARTGQPSGRRSTS